MTYETVFAIHPFEAENEDEIPFEVGEPIIIIEKDDLYKDSWWKGKNIHGQVGLFPMTYISYERPSSNTKENSQPDIPTIASNTHESDLDLPLPPFRMPSPSIDETIDDIHNKLQRMGVREEYPNRLNQQNNNNIWSSKNGRSNRLFMASSSGSSTTSSRFSSTGRQQSSPHSPFDSVDTTRRKPSSTPSTTTNGRQTAKHPVIWDVDQVCTWLAEKGFESEVRHFIDNDITGDVLIGLSVSTLSEELNITSYGKRVRIMNAIKELKAQYGRNSNEGDDMSDYEEYPNDTQSTKFYQNSLYSHQAMDSSVNLQYGITSSLSLPQISEAPGHSVGSPRTSVPNMSNNMSKNYPNYPPTYYTYSQRVDDAEGANIETVTPKSSNKKLFSKFNINIAKRSTDPLMKKKDKIRTNSTGTWDKELREIMKYKGILIKSVEDEPVPEKSRTLNFLLNRKKRTALDRSSFVGSQLGLPKQSLDGRSFVENGNFSDGAPDYEGWLKKQGDKYKTWKSRYCMLKGTNFYYFKNDKEIDPSSIKGYINLTGFRIIPDENLFYGKYGFKLIHDIEKSHYFAHDDEKKLKGWMRAMMKATIERDNHAPVISSSNIATVPLSEARKLTPRPPDPKRPSVINPTSLNKVSSPLLRPASPLSQRTGSPVPTVPTRPLSPTLYNSSSPLMRPFANNRSTMGYF